MPAAAPGLDGAGGGADPAAAEREGGERARDTGLGTGVKPCALATSAGFRARACVSGACVCLQRARLEPTEALQQDVRAAGIRACSTTLHRGSGGGGVEVPGRE